MAVAKASAKNNNINLFEYLGEIIHTHFLFQ